MKILKATENRKKLKKRERNEIKTRLETKFQSKRNSESIKLKNRDIELDKSGHRKKIVTAMGYMTDRKELKNYEQELDKVDVERTL